MPAWLLLSAVFCTLAGFADAQTATGDAAAKRFSALPHPVLDRIHSQKAVSCGISKEEEDYSRAEDHGNRAAFDIDLCKAVAVATLGPGAPLVIKSYPDEPAAVQALLSGEVDLLASASPTVANTARGLLFTTPVFYDGQGFLVPLHSGVRSPVDLAGKRVCYLTGSAAENGLHSYADAHAIHLIWYPFSEAGEMEAAFFTGNCDALTSDITQLANIRAIDPKRSTDFTLLPDLIRQDPLAAATSAADYRFSAIVNWTIQTIIMAEQLGVTRANAVSSGDGDQRDVRQLLGLPYGTGTLLGLNPRWGAQVIGAVGNYGEIYVRDLGAHSPLRIDRGESRLWTDGGLLFAIPPNDQ